MWEFLAWLYAQASKVYELLGWLWGKVKDAALYAYKWALDEATKAYNRAVSAARGLFDDALAFANTIKSYASKLVAEVYAWVKPYIESRINTLTGWIDNFIDATIKPLYALYDTIKSWVLVQIDKAMAWINPLVESVRQSLMQLINPFLPLLTPIKTLTEIFSPQNRAIFLDMVGSLYATMKLFVSNPLGFIFGIMWGSFVNFLCFALAYALGTTKYTLPPLPVWGGSGFGGVILPGTPPPPGASGLVPPLDRLYISGYIFRPGHYGVDFGCISHQPVYAMHAGTVVVAGWSNVGYGLYVVIQGDDWWSLYGHLVTLNVQVNQVVKAGETLGGGDTTGNSTGNHLHLEIKYKGSYIDPVTVLSIG